MAQALVVAIVGAESTGKTSLARALAEAVATRHGLRATWVPEHLRAWCKQQGRTPQHDEQAAIAAAQSAAIDDAARTHDVVVADTTALMTAVYSQYIFGDHGLDIQAVAAHRRCQVTLLTAIDLPWVADGLQRDGPQVREPVDALLRTLLHRHGIGHTVVHGQGHERLQRAIQAVEAHLPRPR